MTTDNLISLSTDPSTIHELASYKTLGQEELNRRIQKVREELGDSLLILGHHYQQDDVIPVSYTHLTLPTICSV